MKADGNGSSRRDLVIRAGRLASAVSLTTLITPAASFAATPPSPHATPAGDWDLSWVRTLATATDRAVFDWPSLGDPADPQVMYFAERYLDNCKAAYAPGKYDARAVLNRGAIILVCDFALGHLSERLARKTNREAVEIHQALRSAFVPGAFAVPSGIFGLAKAQNAGCAYIRL